MSESVPAAMRDLVQQRSGHRCEYCLLHEEDAGAPHEPDHIIARKHRGETRPENLAWTCFLCNRHKGTDIASIDGETSRLVRLFNPRSDTWAEHFRLERAIIIPLTAEGRVTEYLLQFNLSRRVRTRELLIMIERYPD